MSSVPLSIGTVLKCEWDERPIRILMFDEVETLYDSWWPHADAWGLASLKGRASYYRISTPFLIKRSHHLRLEPLNERELAVHRPDLPLRLCRNAKLTWSGEAYAHSHQYELSLKAKGFEAPSMSTSVILNIPKVYLLPFGPKGSSKAGVLVESEDKTHFTTLELLWKAHNIQATHIQESIPGTGLYRHGFQRGIPSYYIWHNRDRANFLEDGM